MREMIEALVVELKQWKRSGTEHVQLYPDRLEALSGALADQLQEPSIPSARPTSKKPAPDPQAVAEGPPERKLLKSTRAAHSGPSVFEQSMKEKASAMRPQPKAQAVEKPRLTPPVIELPAGSKQEQWDWLSQRVLDCPICQKYTPEGKKVVFGSGNLDADLFLCGEAPGAEETIQGEPFVGPAGQLLDKIMATAGWKREDLYIGNIMNWRPDNGKSYGNRPPNDEELAYCLPYLEAQLGIVQPKVILALGKTAVKGLLFREENFSLGRVHGRWHTFEGTEVMPTYHPSYLLHNKSNQAKRMVWEDIMLVMEKLGRPISDKQRRFFQ